LSGLLIDTQVLVWIGAGDSRLPSRVQESLVDPRSQLFVSAVTAWEFSDLELRGRLPNAVSLMPIVDMLSASILDFPRQAWETVAGLPPLHRDPVDRMVIGHALVADLTVVTGDAIMRRYPVRTLW
jgi:PIN domain nuclease of toxin-antitoxin system